MLKSATGISDQARGFTLLETLVVVFIVALLASLVGLSLGRNDQQQVDREARRLLEDFTHARDLALNQHRLVRWQADEAGYVFAQRDSLGRWQDFETRALPKREWRGAVQLSPNAALQDATNKEWQVVFFPSGEVTPGTLVLQGEDAQRHIRITSRGFELLESSDAP